MQCVWFVVGLGIGLLLPICAAHTNAAAAANGRIVAIRALVVPHATTADLIIEFDVAGTTLPLTLLLEVPPGTVAELSNTTILADLDAATRPAETTRQLLAWRAEHVTPPPAMPLSADQVTLEHLQPGAASYTAQEGANQFIITAHAAGRLPPIRLQGISDPAAMIATLWPPDAYSQLTLYVLAEQRVEIAGMQTEYAGQDVLPLIPPVYREDGRFITRLATDGAAQPTAPPAIRPAADTTPLRTSVVRIVYIDGWRRMAIPIAAVMIVLFSSMAAYSAALIIRKRIDAIGGGSS
ncbi:MAG TPA: hypothetical protein PKA05_03165 [Roseiflexaceae bacterium]|nr:hypothetical protein [Roseiflexaceae bacterium]